LKLHADAGEPFEGVGKHQELRLGIRVRSLPIDGKPGGPDFDPAIVLIDVQKAAGANQPTGCVVAYCEAEGPSFGLLLEALPQKTGKILLGLNLNRVPLPNLRIQDWVEFLEVSLLERLEGQARTR